ncbi:UDP-GlcNAc--UDP-phosphate GlcNAc-1-phosphate transferase [Chryseobacterium sp. 6424]|uniref:MraY family glycosyltransferase n=1 Tax=Chryseobacterium sp. 6424 TaxID=2039166 RepID=UPI000EFCF71C|nr:glycosyltransferase family 4 protein [Chryseobacterium sp. 6424]AYO57058.1 UDP-GlcNAc--UDP-phosphate GlcNAc-1-phosphate transferase [Chryseobacterium sp. 6424]
MEYLLIILLLTILMLLYFKIARRFNIIDKPNHRSAHSEVTIRGGGIVFPIAFLLFLAMSYGRKLADAPLLNTAPTDQNYLLFGIGLGLICLISFIDDVMDLSGKIRIIFHVAAVTFLLLFLEVFLLPVWVIGILYILIIGILNGYNFMDGINGITGLYSLGVLATLFYVNENVVDFVTPAFIIYPAIACLVFLFFNFRKKARCFMGDIGSMGIAFWIIALIGLLMTKTAELKWILFLAVYGVEVIATLLERIRLRENIFKAHRRHLYQLFVNEKKVSHLVVSSVYAACQLVLNIFIISSSWPAKKVFPIVLIPLVLIYFLLKYRIKKQITHLNV